MKKHFIYFGNNQHIVVVAKTFIVHDNGIFFLNENGDAIGYAPVTSIVKVSSDDAEIKKDPPTFPQDRR